MRVLLAQINPTVGDLSGNAELIRQAFDEARASQVELLIFPELALTGYPPEDLLLLPDFLEKTRETFEELIPKTKGLNVILGLPRTNKGRLYNSAALLSDGRLLGFQDKCLLPTYDVFDERRYFTPGDSFSLWHIAGKRVAVTICEDIWQHAKAVTETIYLSDPIQEYIDTKPDLLVNLSSSPFRVNKHQLRIKVCQKAAKTLGCPVLFCNQVGGNDSLLFDGYSLIVDADGSIRKVGKGFEEDYLLDSLDQKSALVNEEKNDSIQDLHDALVMGVRDYFLKQGLTKACLGISGGVDSAVVACIAVKALGKENVFGLRMPSRYSSEGSLEDAKLLIDQLGIPSTKVPIEEPFQSYIDLLSPHFDGGMKGVTEENIQARIRGMILMAFSNKSGYIVLSTGNKSEMAMGYATLYGDLCGGLGVINDVSKGQVYDLARWINREKEVIPTSTLTKPPSAELAPDQKDSDTLPDYAIIDTVLEEYVEHHRPPEMIIEQHGYPKEVVEDIIRRIHLNEYKRRQGPLGLRVSQKAFSVGRRFPIVQKWR